MLRSSFVGLAAVLLLAACSDRRNPMSPRAEQPALAVSDGAHNGNVDFFFLPPMAANPSSHAEFDAGRFNAKLQPVVKICRLDAATASVCEAEIASFTGSAISVGVEQYHVNWNTSGANLELGRMYRVQVIVGSTTVGYMDVDPVKNGSELRSVNTNEYIGLVDGKTLPIKFRIERGVTCSNRSDCAEETVTNAGGIVVTNTGYAGVDFPSGWLPVNPATGKPYENVTVKIERVPVGPDNRCHLDLNLQQYEGCYEFTTQPDVGVFARPVVAGICTEVSETDPLYAQLVFYTSGEGEETKAAPEAPAPFVNCEGFTGTPAPVNTIGLLERGLTGLASNIGRFLTPKSAYAIDVGVGGEMSEFSRGGWAVEAEAQVVSGDAQVGAPGLALANAVTVRVLGHHGRPVPGIPVTFTPSAGGSAASEPVLTNTDGIASTSWTLGATPGAQTLTVSGPLKQTLTVSATAQQVLASVTLAPARIDFGLGQTTAQVAMTQIDASGNPMSPAVACTWTVTSNRGAISVDQSGVISSTRDDDGSVTAVCGDKSAGTSVEAGDYQFTATGSISDPTGDAKASSIGSPDLVAMTATVAERQLTFDVFYSLSSVTGVSAHSNIGIDVDQNTATGHPGLNASGTLDASIISSDYIFVIDNASATLRKYSGTLNSFSTVTTVSCTVSDSPTTRRFSCTIPLSRLGYDEGFVNFKATSAANYPSGGNTGILDQITDAGQPAGSTGYSIP